MVSQITDPELLRQLEGDSSQPVSDPSLLAQLEGNVQSSPISEPPRGFMENVGSVASMIKESPAYQTSQFGVAEKAEDLLRQGSEKLGGFVQKDISQGGNPQLGKAVGKGISTLGFQNLGLVAPVGETLPTAKALFNNPVTRGVGDVAATAGQWSTNIPKKEYKVLFRNPEGILPGSLKRASSEFSKASIEAGIPEKLTPDQLKMSLSPRARKIVGDVYEKIFSNQPVSAAEAQNAKQMLDAIYPNPTAKNARLLHQLDEVRDTLQDVISRESPALREANRKYSIAKSGSKFKSLFPKTMTSRPEFIRSGLLGTLALKNPAAAALLTPIGQGILTAGSGAVTKGAEALASRPQIAMPMVNRLMPKEGKKGIKNMPKKVVQNGYTYILNEQTGQYE